MSAGGLQAWLFIAGMKNETWVVSPGPGVIQPLGGQVYEKVYVPGLLITFPTAKAALQAALRCHTYLAPMFQDSGIPPMAIDVGAKPKTLPVLVFDRQARTIIGTQSAMKYLASEPLELIPGPDVPLEDGEVVKTRIVPVSSFNVGWSLPTVDVGEQGGLPSYTKKSEPAIINIQMGAKRGFGLPFRVPWKAVIIFGLAGLLLLVGYQLMVSITENMPGVQKTKAARQVAVIADDPESVGTPLDMDYARVNTLGVLGVSTATPVPPGIGSVVIETTPKNAEIMVNEKVIAKSSPVKLEDQSNQDVLMLTVSKKGYETYTRVFNIEADKETILRVALKKTKKRSKRRRK